MSRFTINHRTMRTITKSVAANIRPEIEREEECINARRGMVSLRAATRHRPRLHAPPQATAQNACNPKLRSKLVGGNVSLFPKILAHVCARVCMWRAANQLFLAIACCWYCFR